jgi:hypothetical protein
MLDDLALLEQSLPLFYDWNARRRSSLCLLPLLTSRNPCFKIGSHFITSEDAYALDSAIKDTLVERV